MKLVTFKQPSGRIAPGVLGNDLTTITDLGTDFPDMLSLIDAGDAGLAKVRERVENDPNPIHIEDVVLLSPIPVPRRLRDCSVFEEHVQGVANWARNAGVGMLAEVPKVWFEEPVFYKCNHLSVVGPDVDVPFPGQVHMFDYELEIAAVIGKKGRNIPEAEADSYIFGFMIFNDFSIRDVAGKELPALFGPAKAKDFDCGNALGPWLVTADEIDDWYALEMVASLNGQEMGRSGTAKMYHKWSKIISYCSSLSETLYPGEIIGSGTCGGGTLAEKGRKLSVGDEVVLSITGLGTLRNRVVAEI